MTPLAFARRYNGTRITSSGGVGGECVDLANQWLAECCGLAHVFRNAVEWAQLGLAGMRWTINTPLNAPLPGSLAVWAPTPSLGIGPNGHIALVLIADNMTLLTLDQNWPVGSAVEMRLHPYAGVVGWQVPLSY